MQNIWLLIFEICVDCNLGKEHNGKCPNLHRDRYKLVDTSQSLADEKIIDLAKEAYNNMGFKGLIGFHYYNEPLIAKNRMLGLIKQIKNEIPQAKFILWTNGELISSDCSELNCFDEVVITNYHNRDFEQVKSIIPKVTVSNGNLDERLNAKGYPSSAPCCRMLTEFIIDYFGNVHICCIDWRGKVKVGNVWRDSLSSLLVRWHIIREQISGKVMSKDAPEVCRKCTHKYYLIGHHPVWRERIRNNFSLLTNSPTSFFKKCINKIKKIVGLKNL